MSKRILPALLVWAVFFTLATAAAGDDIRARADRVSGQVKGTGRDIVVLEGHVHITHGKTVITGDRTVYDKEAGTLAVSGGVRLQYESVRVEANELLYQRQTKEGTFRGQVKLAREEEKDESGKVTKDGFTITCDEMVFAAEKKDFTARGQACMVHKEFTATAQEIAYDDEHQELELTGGPTLTHEDEVIKAERIIISVEGDSFTVIKAEITFMVEEDDGQGSGTEAATGGQQSVATDGGSTPPAP